MNLVRSTVLLSAAAAGVIAAAAFLRPGTGAAADADKTERTVTVSATGAVIAEPDVAYVSTGVVTEADAAKDAITRNNAVMAKLIEGLKDAGIAAKDIRTTTFSVEPRYTQPKDGRAATISGYRVSNQLRLTVRLRV